MLNLTTMAIALFVIHEFSGLVDRYASEGTKRLGIDGLLLIILVGVAAWPTMGAASWIALLAIVAGQQLLRWLAAIRIRPGVLREAALVGGPVALLWLWAYLTWRNDCAVGGNLGTAWAGFFEEQALWALVALGGLSVAIGGGTALVRALLTQLGKEVDEQMGVGRVIGNLERILIFVLALDNQFGAVGFVLTAKSLARFEDLKDQKFAEYYLVGTLSSALVALGAARVVVLLWGLMPR